MEVPMSQEDEDMPIPLNSRYGGSSYDHHHHHHTISQHSNTNTNIKNSQLIPSPNGVPSAADNFPPSATKKVINTTVVRYKECLKNHAASMGGNATDGCGEFMPGGEPPSLEALICSACSCHRNFHRKEIQGDNNNGNNNFYNNSRILGKNNRFMNNMGQGLSAGPAHRPVILSCNNYMGGPSDSDEGAGGSGGGGGAGAKVAAKKRFRTKFTQEQKEKMLCFAEKVGWKLQKQEEGAVQQFCQEIGVKRRVLKVWMHNNKHSLAKKMNHDHHLQTNDGISDQDRN